MSEKTDRVVLHALRLSGFTNPVAEVARRAGLPVAELEAALRDLADRGLARHYDAPRPGWALTPAGKEHGEHLLAAELDRSGRRRALDELYTEFLPLNRRVLEVCTAWQVRVGTEGLVPNDHTDDAYDLAVIARLMELHEESGGLLGRISSELDRFASYGARLDAAAELIRAGQTQYFTRPMIDSYHTIWFELHEDLLATLGRERSEELEPSGEGT